VFNLTVSSVGGAVGEVGLLMELPVEASQTVEAMIDADGAQVATIFEDADGIVRIFVRLSYFIRCR
jgi:hypothetical protein